MSAIIEVRDLVKQYDPPRGVRAVDGVSFDIAQGEIFSLLGPNGAGKTTTISMLSCLLAPTSGDATVAGHSITHEAQAVKRVIGVVPQDVALYPTLTARENLHFWGRMYAMGGAALNRRIDEVLDIVGLRDRANERIDKYSGGMKRRINIAVGLLHQPRIIYMDEPTVGIDPQSRRNILDTVRALNQQGMTVLYTTHYMEEAQELSHRIAIMDRGKVIALGTKDELTRLVGHQDSLHLMVDAAPEALIQSYWGVPGVSQVTVSDNAISLLAEDGNAVLPALIAMANQAGVKVHSIEIREPNLEMVFLHLTGKALRD